MWARTAERERAAATNFRPKPESIMLVWGGAETVPIARPNDRRSGPRMGFKSGGGPGRWGVGRWGCVHSLAWSLTHDTPLGSGRHENIKSVTIATARTPKCHEVPAAAARPRRRDDRMN